MQNTPPPPERNPPLIPAIQELMIALRNLAKSEIKLARAELRSTLRTTAKETLLIAFSGFVAVLGLLPFMTFLVIGLGKLLGDNYWLSSLLVSLVFLILGAALTLYLIRRISEEDLTLPHTRHSLRTETRRTQDRSQDRTQKLRQNELWRKAS